jgi:hypothetical protein
VYDTKGGIQRSMGGQGPTAALSRAARQGEGGLMSQGGEGGPDSTDGLSQLSRTTSYSSPSFYSEGVR